jgi:hypothetical protein
VNAPVAWVRVVPDGMTPSPAGALMAMEVAHTSALIPAPRGFGYHSTNIQADGTKPNRAYNLDTHQYLADDRTVTRLYQPWHNNNTVLERDDWLYAVCKLTPGGPTSVECPTAGGVGGRGLPVPMVMLSGLTDGTTAGTSVGQSYVSPEGGFPLVDEMSTYRLRQKAGASFLRDDGVPVSSELSNHGAGGEPGPSLFSVATEFDSRTTRLELVNTSVRPARVLYAVDRNLDPTGGNAPPGIIGIGLQPGGRRNVTDTGDIHETAPALSDDGRLLAWAGSTDAWERPDVLVVAFADNPAVRAAVPGCDRFCHDPAWSSDGRALAFVQNRSPLAGDEEWFHGIFTIAVDPSRSPADPGFFLSDSPTMVYGATTPFMAVSHPTWSMGGATAATTSIAFESEVIRSAPPTAEIHVVGALGESPPEMLTPPGEEARHPAWSHTPGDDRIAYERWPPICERGCDRPSSIVALDPVSGSSTVLVDSSDRGQGGIRPSWGTAGRIAFEGLGPQGRSMLLMEAVAGATPKLIGTGQDPSLAGNRVAFADEAFDEGLDMFVADMEDRVVLDAHAPPGSRPMHIPDLRLDLYLSCGPSGLRYPVAVSVAPSAFDSQGGASARFSVTSDMSLACGNSPRTAPALEAVLSDGFLRSAPGPTLPVDSAGKRPVVSISGPSAVDLDERGGRPYLHGTPVRLIGSATDAEDGPLHGDSLEWFLDDGAQPVARGPNGAIAAPPPGVHRLVLRARDADGNIGEGERVFEVLADADRDGIPARRETCSSDNDPLDAFTDTDGDGSLNGDAYARSGLPCAPSTEFEASADFDPDVLRAGAGGRSVTVTLGKVPRPWSEVDDGTVRLVLPGAPGCAPVELPLTAGGWRAEASGATAKFDRQAVTAYLVETCHLGGGRIPVTVTGSSQTQYGPWSFTGNDTILLT